MVAAALLSHVLGHFGVWDVLGENTRLYLRLFSRGATPGLLILFGFMIELVYVRHAKQKGFSFSIQRMMYRVILCYLAFILIASIGFLTGLGSLRSFLGNFLLVSPAINANIFAIYFFVLLLMMPIIAVRLRFGVNALLAIVSAVWLVDSLALTPLGSPFAYSSDTLEYLANFFVGVGDSWGPSIFHSLTVTLFGMVLSNAFVERSRKSLSRLAVFAGLAFFIVCLEISKIGWITFLGNIADYTAYRAHNSIVFYAYGILFSLTLMLLAWSLNKILFSVIRHPVTYLGARTFLYFLLGNMILTAFPRTISIDLLTALLIFVLLTSLCYALIKLWEAKFHHWTPVAETRRMMLTTSSYLTKVLLGIQTKVISATTRG